ncbi:hypothetical protein M9H77_15171 [Catharanthus roseus]|uniref:Uncharacterized protein n=1 Tax=Catharanthus roseus TaxID=4058 RepID=A0ACC0BQC9_CATRO|nr:hypothetical protein M9H77_15171 [Catharanthus roseus]
MGSLKGSKRIGKKEMCAFEYKCNGILPNSLGFQWSLQDDNSYPFGGLFASVGQTGNNIFGVSPKSPKPRQKNDGFKLPYADLFIKYLPFMEGIMVDGIPDEEEEADMEKKKKRGGLKLKVKVANPSLRRLVSGAIAGVVSRSVVAPLETIRTHLIVGSSCHSTSEVFHNIIQQDGWKGLFRGNLANVIRVAPNKAIELFVYDTINKHLSSKPDEKRPKICIPPSLIAGACAGVSSDMVTYPLELLKTRLTIERGKYNGLLDAFVKIVSENGPGELYRGLTANLIGVIPYAATNYFVYDTLQKVCRKILKKEKISDIETLLIGSVAGAISCSATFPLEVARKRMQVGVGSGRHVYKNIFHAFASIVEQEGIQGLYRGLGPSCIRLVPAAGISFMCYEACKRLLVEDEEEA